MRPLRIAFDVLAQLRFSDAEYAAVLHAASTLKEPSLLRWEPAPCAKLAEAMLLPRTRELVEACGVSEAAWLERAATVRDSDVLALAVQFLQLHANEVPDTWFAELPREARPSPETQGSSANV